MAKRPDTLARKRARSGKDRIVKDPTLGNKYTRSVGEGTTRKRRVLSKEANLRGRFSTPDLGATPTEDKEILARIRGRRNKATARVAGLRGPTLRQKKAA